MNFTSIDCCPVCSSTTKSWRTKSTPYGKFNIVRCNRCGFAFVNPRPTQEFITNYYSDFGHSELMPKSLNEVLRREHEFPDSTVDAKRMIKTIFDLLQLEPVENSFKFLDVGCGYGFFTKEALSAGFKVSALEIASVERLLAEQMTKIKPLHYSFEDFPGVEESYSVILMSHVLEHAFDVNRWIQKAYCLLAPNGVLAIALPNFTNVLRLIRQHKDPYIVPPEHLNFFSPKSLTALLIKHGFEVKKIQWISRLDIKLLNNTLASTLLKATLKTLDKLHLGFMISIYAKKSKQEIFP